MKKIRDLMEKYPFLYLIYALAGCALLWVSVRVVPPIKAGAFTTGLNELKAALIVLFVYWLLSARVQDLKPDYTGFSYGFRVMRGIFILVFLILIVGLFTIFSAVKAGASLSWMGIKLLNAALLCLAVGVVEEFTCRAMLFGGLIRVCKPTHRGVIWAALISAFAFGFIHVAADVFSGTVTDAMGIIQVTGKTLEAGVFGFVLALIYQKTRSIWSVAALHSLFDFLILVATLAGDKDMPSYVSKDAGISRISSFIYIFLSLIMIPTIVRCLRELKKEPEPCCCPSDEAFAPRALTYEKRRK